jgi:hypothetical protein
LKKGHESSFNTQSAANYKLDLDPSQPGSRVPLSFSASSSAPRRERIPSHRKFVNAHTRR